MTIKEFFESEEKLAIHCNTKAKARKLLNEFKILGYKWNTGDSYYYDFWDIYESKTCYFNSCEFGNIDFYENPNYVKIIEFEDIEF